MQPDEVAIDIEPDRARSGMNGTEHIPLRVRLPVRSDEDERIHRTSAVFRMR